VQIKGKLVPAPLILNHGGPLDTEKTWPILNRSTHKQVMFLWKYMEKQFFCFCGHNIL